MRAPWPRKFNELASLLSALAFLRGEVSSRQFPRVTKLMNAITGVFVKAGERFDLDLFASAAYYLAAPKIDVAPRKFRKNGLAWNVRAKHLDTNAMWAAEARTQSMGLTYGLLYGARRRGRKIAQRLYDAATFAADKQIRRASVNRPRLKIIDSETGEVWKPRGVRIPKYARPISVGALKRG